MDILVTTSSCRAALVDSIHQEENMVRRYCPTWGQTPAGQASAPAWRGVQVQEEGGTHQTLVIKYEVQDKPNEIRRPAEASPRVAPPP